MFDRDFDEFAALIDGAISLNPNWKPIQPAGKALFFNAMAPYSLDQVRSGLTGHLRDPKAGMFQPTPAHLIAHIEARSGGDGRPGAEEAWAIALTSRDEADTVVWTQETAEAFGICGPIMALGDEVGARMAFKEAYQRLVTAARANGVPARWSASLGWDIERRTAALTKASNAGLLPAPVVAGLLPPPASETINDAGARTQISKIKEMLAQMSQEKRTEQGLHAQREREATAEAKAKANAMTAQYKRQDAA